MSQINCEACETLRVNAAAFVQHGVTNTECNSMANDTGINPNLSPKHNDATDLHTANDCLVGKMNDDIESYNVCDWQDFMHKFMSNLHELLKLMICALGGIWTKIHDLISRVTSLESRMTNVENRLTTVEGDVSNLKGRMTTAEGNITNLQNTVGQHTTAINNLTTNYNELKDLVEQVIAAMGGDSTKVTVVKKYSYTVPAAKFIETNHWNGYTGGGSSVVIGQWFSGSPNEGECYITIPTTDMETVVGVWAQPYVVPAGNPFDGIGRVAMQTVAVQTWTQQGSNIIVNFDTYELDYPTGGGYHGSPYPITVDFLVVGTKTINVPN